MILGLQWYLLIFGASSLVIAMEDLEGHGFETTLDSTTFVHVVTDTKHVYGQYA